MTRIEEELELLKTAYPGLEYRLEGDQHWIRLLHYPVPAGWSTDEVEMACVIPGQAGQQPYGFFVRPALTLASGGMPTNYTNPAATPWGGDFAQFSWAPLGEWLPRTDIRVGANMLNFVRSFAERLREAS